MVFHWSYVHGSSWPINYQSIRKQSEILFFSHLWYCIPLTTQYIVLIEISSHQISPHYFYISQNIIPSLLLYYVISHFNRSFCHIISHIIELLHTFILYSLYFHIITCFISFFPFLYLFSNYILSIIIITFILDSDQ